MMKLLILADIDDLHWNFDKGEADLVISCGDIADQVVLEAAKAYGCSRIMAVKGNHDGPAPFPPPITDLHLKVVRHGNLTFGGFNGSWKYKPRGNFLYEQLDVTRRLETFPAVDVFVSHNSPRFIHDQEDDIHCGFTGLKNYITRTQPRLLIHGHQHRNVETMVTGTSVIGVYGWRLLHL